MLILGSPGKITARQIDTPFLPLYLVTVAGPFIAGFLLTGLCDGIKGYRDLLAQLTRWRVHLKWYAIALLIAPLSVFAALFALSIFSPAFLPAIFSSGDNPVASVFGLEGNNKIILVPFVLMIGLFNGFIEEAGWTGFATSKQRIRHSLFATGLNIGIVWGLWHFFSNYIGSAAEAGTFPLPLYMAAVLFSFLPPFRILMTWVYDHTRSLFVAILMHSSLDIFWMLSMPSILTGHQRVIWYIVWAVILWVMVATTGMIGRRWNRMD